MQHNNNEYKIILNENVKTYCYQQNILKIISKNVFKIPRIIIGKYLTINNTFVDKPIK